MENQGNNGSNLPREVKEIDLISNYVPERNIEDHHRPNTEVDLTLNLSLGGSAQQPILPKENMPVPPSSSAAAIEVGPSSGRRMSWKKRARAANAHVAPQEVPPPDLSQATIDSVMSNSAFRRSIAVIKSVKDQQS